jgi:hypothetical protein
MAVFWGMVPCSLLDRYLNATDTCCLHLQEYGRSRRIDTVYMWMHVDSTEFPASVTEACSEMWCRAVWRVFWCSTFLPERSYLSTKLYGVTSQKTTPVTVMNTKKNCIQVSHVRIFWRKNLYCIVYVLSAVKVYIKMGNWFRFVR